MDLLNNESKWKSVEEIKVLNHNLNFSNWTNTYACVGKWKIEIYEKIDNVTKIKIFMPTARYGESHSGFWVIYSGKVEIENTELLIWQNEEEPVRLTYQKNESNIKIDIFGETIEFISD